jgi:inner membrane protein YhjD
MSDRSQQSRRGAVALVTDTIAAVAIVFSAVVNARRPRRPPRPDGKEIHPSTTADASEPSGPGRLVGRIDRWQRHVGPLAFLVGVVKKFGDDRAGRLAALVAYYGFFSLFPLLLVAVTVVGYIFGDQSASEIKSSAIGQIPIVGDQIGSQVQPLQGSVVPLVIGVATALWAGLGCMQAAQDAMNELWAVPRLEQPSFALKRLRSVGVLTVIGSSLLVGAVVSQLLSSVPALAGAGRIVAVTVSIVVNAGVYLVAFQLLATGRQRWRALLPGAIAAGVGYTVLQFAGQWYVRRTISGAQDTYGTFAAVIGLLGWLYLLAQLSIFAAEINVVWAKRLWPRSLLVPPRTRADQVVTEEAARSGKLRADAEVTVRFSPARGDDPV